jgi:uncharacterized protein YigA (DUF484 family)
MMSPPPDDMHPSETPAPTETAVAAFLREHPNYLAENADLYRVLTPPCRVHGDQLADHMAAMLTAERAHAATLSKRADDVLSARRAGAGLTARIQEAVLALISSQDPLDWVTQDLPSLLGLDAASLCMERTTLSGARSLATGDVARLLGPRAVLVREQPTEKNLLHGEAAALASIDALIRVPLRTPALLAIASRKCAALHPRQGEAALAYLGRAIAATMLRT